MLEMVKIILVQAKQCIQCKWQYDGGTPRMGALGSAMMQIVGSIEG